VVRQSGHATEEGRAWLERLGRAQAAVDAAADERDELVRQALAEGVGVRGVALALGIDKGTVSRHYGKRKA
jgi:DNA invertase Pin-like site-specific DNA recombinase